MQRRQVLQAAGGLAGSAALMGCARIAPVRNVDNAAFAGQAPLARRSAQVKRAGADLGWVMEDVRPGLARGTLNLRTHQAVVDIPYDQSRFSIRYVSSKDLNYNGTLIHNNYNGWVQNLQQRIVAESAL